MHKQVENTQNKISQRFKFQYAFDDRSKNEVDRVVKSYLQKSNHLGVEDFDKIEKQIQTNDYIRFNRSLSRNQSSKKLISSSRPSVVQNKIKKLKERKSSTSMVQSYQQSPVKQLRSSIQYDQSAVRNSTNLSSMTPIRYQADGTAIIGETKQVNNKLGDEKDNTVTKISKEQHISPYLQNNSNPSPDLYLSRSLRSLKNPNVLDQIASHSTNKFQASPVRQRLASLEETSGHKSVRFAIKQAYSNQEKTQDKIPPHQTSYDALNNENYSWNDKPRTGKRLYGSNTTLSQPQRLDPDTFHPTSLNIGQVYYGSIMSNKLADKQHQDKLAEVNKHQRNRLYVSKSVQRLSNGIADIEGSDAMRDSLPPEITHQNIKLFNNDKQHRYKIVKKEDEWDLIQKAKLFQAEREEENQKIQQKKLRDDYRKSLQNQMDAKKNQQKVEQATDTKSSRQQVLDQIEATTQADKREKDDRIKKLDQARKLKEEALQIQNAKLQAAQQVNDQINLTNEYTSLPQLFNGRDNKLNHQRAKSLANQQKNQDLVKQREQERLNGIVNDKLQPYNNDNFLDRLMDNNINDLNKKIEKGRQKIDDNQNLFVKNHKDNGNRDNPLLSMKDKEKIAESLADKQAQQKAQENSKADEYVKQKKLEDKQKIQQWQQESQMMKNVKDKERQDEKNKEKQSIDLHMRRLNDQLNANKINKSKLAQEQQDLLNEQIYQKQKSDYIYTTKLTNKEHGLNKELLESAEVQNQYGIGASKAAKNYGLLGVSANGINLGALHRVKMDVTGKI